MGVSVYFQCLAVNNIILRVRRDYSENKQDFISVSLFLKRKLSGFFTTTTLIWLLLNK